MKNKKAQLPILKILLTLITIAIFLISWILVLNLDTTINQKKINTQLIAKKILGGNCFSNKYATINMNSFTNENLKQCLGNHKNLEVKIKISNTDQIFLNTEETFNNNRNKCSQTSTVLCTELKYPIITKNEKTTKINELSIQIISK